MAIEGTLDELKLPDILQMVGQQGKTGILTIQGEATIVAVSFLNGRVVAADSLEETVEERLGEVLVSRGLLSRRDFARVVEEQRQGKGRLVDLLVDGGYLDRAEVLESLHLQTTQLLAQILDWERGEFKFYANDEVAFEEGFRPIAVDELLISLLPEEGGEDEPEEGPLADVVPLSGARRGAAEEAAPEPDWREVTWTGEEVGDGTGAEEPPSRGLAPYVPPQGPAQGPAPGPGEADGPAAAEPPVAPRPEPELDLAEEPVAPKPAPGLALPVGAVAAALGAALALALAAVLVAAPGSFLFPMPWQQDELGAYRGVQRQALYQTLDSAAKTYYLAENRFPDTLETLVTASLLHPRDLVGPEGRRLEIRVSGESYEIGPVGGGGDDLALVEATTGDFLLDPELLSSPQVDRTPPLVLLD